uniref:Uncharacterized protein n=1 Tax=Anguilla anguilla TaxID=7936 RepID=A0A0E9PCA2_ANGAN
MHGRAIIPPRVSIAFVRD